MSTDGIPTLMYFVPAISRNTIVDYVPEWINYYYEQVGCLVLHLENIHIDIL